MDLKALVQSWVEEAVELRSGVGLPDAATPGPVELRHALVDCRGSLDRVDDLLVTATRLRAAAQRKAISNRATADDQWDQAASRVPGVEFASARERSAQINLFVVSYLRAARQAEEQLSVATEGYDVLRTIQRGLDGLRMDLHRMLTAITFESGLER